MMSAQDIQIWILGSAASLLVGLIIGLFKVGLSKFDKLIKEVQKLNLSMLQNQNQTTRNNERLDEANIRLNTHSERIHELEIFKAKTEN
jgi:uncharacterized protein YneF (UPF0154 family)